MANVSVSDVRDTINVGQADIPDAKLQKMIKRAEVTLELELGKEIDYADCTEAEKEFITVLAAVYAICYLTGGSAVGLNFSVGDQDVSVTDRAPPLSVLQQELDRILSGLKPPVVGSALKAMKVPNAYYQFVMNYAPYVYVVPECGSDPHLGQSSFYGWFRGGFPVRSVLRPPVRSGEIEAKIVELADWTVTQQCTDSEKHAYDGFKSTETSALYYSVDACRTIPALLKAYELTADAAYLNSAKLAAGNFLYNMQHKPSQLSVHNSYYGGFARAVTLSDEWLGKMDVQCLYGLTALKMLRESDPANKDTYETIMADAADVWQVESGFDWTQIKKVHVVCWFDGSGTGSFWMDGLFFGGRRYGTVQEDAVSQSSYGLRELVEVDEELWSDAECTMRAQALLSSLKSFAEQLTLRSTVIDYGVTPLLAGDTVHVVLPNEDVDGDFLVLSVEYYVDAKTQMLETALELGREQPLLADYMFKLKSKTDSLSRYKLART